MSLVDLDEPVLDDLIESGALDEEHVDRTLPLDALERRLDLTERVG